MILSIRWYLPLMTYHSCMRNIGFYFFSLFLGAILSSPVYGGEIQKPDLRPAGRQIISTVEIRDESGQWTSLYRKSHALVVGVMNYSEGWPQLSGVKDDIVHVEQVLTRQGFQVTLLKNPTGDELKRSLEDFIHRYGYDHENRLLVYFAGHGHTERDFIENQAVGYLVPADAPLPQADLKGFYASAVSMKQVEVYARMIQAKHALFMFDSCFSGTIFSSTRSMPENISRLTQMPVRQFISSGLPNETVPDNSIFRTSFIKALQGAADQNFDGYVTATELGLYLAEEVRKKSNDTQHPQYGKIRHARLNKGDFVFQIMQNSAIESMKEDERRMEAKKLSFYKDKPYWQFGALTLFTIASWQIWQESQDYNDLADKKSDLQKSYNDATTAAARSNIQSRFNDIDRKMESHYETMTLMYNVAVLALAVEGYLVYKAYQKGKVLEEEFIRQREEMKIFMIPEKDSYSVGLGLSLRF